jgi:hypothetical protein
VPVARGAHPEESANGEGRRHVACDPSRFETIHRGWGMAATAGMGTTMETTSTASDLSTDPRDTDDRLRAQSPLEYPAPPGPAAWDLGSWDQGTLVFGALAATLAVVVGAWLGGRRPKRKAPTLLPSVNKAELAVEFAPIAMRLMQNPAIRAYVLRMLLRSLARKVGG